MFGYAIVNLSDISTNYDNLREPITKHKRNIGKYPYYGASGIVDYVDDYLFEGNYLLISEDGANLISRNTPIAFSITGKNYVNNHAHVLKFSNKYIQKYVEIYLNASDLSKYISTAAQPKLTKYNLDLIPIPLPNTDTIIMIVDVLLKFENICSDLKFGIPAEIDARQKQYEYYRDKLLTFKMKQE